MFCVLFVISLFTATRRARLIKGQYAKKERKQHKQKKINIKYMTGEGNLN